MHKYRTSKHTYMNTNKEAYIYKQTYTYIHTKNKHIHTYKETNIYLRDYKQTIIYIHEYKQENIYTCRHTDPFMYVNATIRISFRW